MVAVRDQDDVIDPRGLEEGHRQRRVLARVARFALDPADRPAELVGGDLGGDFRLRGRAFLRVAGAAAEGDRRTGLAGEPEAVAQSLERPVLQAADAVLGRERLLRRRLGAQLAHAIEAERRRRLQHLAEEADGTGGGREPEQDDADQDHQPAQAASRQEQARADQDEEEQGHRRQDQRGDHRLPRLDAERCEEAVHVRRVSRPGSAGAIVPEHRRDEAGRGIMALFILFESEPVP